LRTRWTMTDYDDNYDGIDVEIIQEPLLTDDACQSVAIARSKPSATTCGHARAEWPATRNGRQRWIAWREVVGLAYWGVRQIDPDATTVPASLREVIGFFAGAAARFDNNGCTVAAGGRQMLYTSDAGAHVPSLERFRAACGLARSRRLIRNVCTTIPTSAE